MPGVDDGAPDLDTAIRMLRQEAEQGVGKIILTPHQKPGHRCITAEGIEKRLRLLRKEVKRLDIPVRLYPGAELFYCRGMRELLEAGKVCTLAGSRYVLVEFAPAEDWRYIRNAVYDLLNGGYWPILAHVERYSQVAGAPDRARELIEMGAYIQMNAQSITGAESVRTRRNCKALLQCGLVHFVGTDAHRAAGSRSPQLEKSIKPVRKLTGDADELFWRNAENILKNIQI